MDIYMNENVPIYLWADDIEQSAWDQALNLANLPFAYHHIALMPDVHSGYGMPIGGVLATKDVVVPNAVGKDIGCGMIAVRTSLTDIDTTTLKAIMSDIRESIPVGFKHHDIPQISGLFNDVPDIPIIQQQIESAKKQLGTLGGGNHFIEIQKGSDGYIWFMIHSGSRNFGLKIADEYHKKAVKLCERWYSNIPTNELAFLPIETNEGKEYMEAMNYALKFAKHNRASMAAHVEVAFYRRASCMFDKTIDVHHNYAAWEHHYNKNVIVHRKGATSAKEGEEGIIPGSQGTKSYIVRGEGNKQSFMSCSHGAGRVMSRIKARKELNLEEEIAKLDNQGIIHSIRGISNLDEATSAYKNIDEVMKKQGDLVKIEVELTPLGVIKA